MEGLSSKERARARKRSVGFIFQRFGDLSVSENVELPLTYRGLKPAIVLCDEPTGNLGLKNDAMARKLRQELAEGGATIWVVTPDPCDAHDSPVWRTPDERARGGNVGTPPRRRDPADMLS